MEFGIKTCGVPTIKRGKVVGCEEIKPPKSKVINDVKKEGYTYLGIFEWNKIKENEMKEKTIKEYKRRLWLVLKSKLNENSRITAKRYEHWLYLDMEQE